MRLIVSTLLALLLGLIAARMPGFAEADASFSWLGFAGGVAIVSLAIGLGRILAPTAAVANGGAISPVHQWLLRCSLSCLFLALVSFVLLLYTPWQWPRYLATVVIAIGALSVFFGVGAAWFGKRGA